MRLLVDKEKFGNSNIKVFMNRLGYHQFFDRNSNQVSYMRRLRQLDYPRFHVYIEQKADGWQLNLHLDAKKPSYQGYHAHSGEYEGPLVEEEFERIRQSIEVNS